MVIEYKAIIFVILAIVLFGFSDFAAKMFANNLTGSFREMLLNKRTVGSFLIMGVLAIGGFLCWTTALRFGDLSKLVPIQKLSLIITVLLAIVVLHEAWSWKTVAATGMAVGAILLLI
jgi:transporter family protein